MYCNKCGTKGNDGDRFCRVCGTPLENQTGANPPYPQTPSQPVRSDNRKIFSILAYISPLWLVGMLCSPEKNDGGVRFHVGQGIILTIFSFICSFISGILNFILQVIAEASSAGVMLITIPIGIVAGVLVFALSVINLIFMGIGIYNAYNGNLKELPVIGQFAFYK